MPELRGVLAFTKYFKFVIKYREVSRPLSMVLSGDNTCMLSYYSGSVSAERLPESHYGHTQLSQFSTLSKNADTVLHERQPRAS